MIAGKMGSGKDTLSDRLKDFFLNVDIKYKNYALANYLKEIIKIPYPNFNKKENRKDIQFLGEFLKKNRRDMSIQEVLHFRRNFYSKNNFDKFINNEIKNSKIFTDEYFCEKIFTPEFYNSFYNKRNVIITDCRRTTEYNYFKELDPDLVFIYVDCLYDIRKKRIIERDYKGEITKEINDNIDEYFQEENGIENLKNYADYIYNNDGDDGKFNLQHLINDYVFKI